MALMRISESQLPESLLKEIEELKARVGNLEKEIGELKEKQKHKDNGEEH